jgi:hypothetical protein
VIENRRKFNTVNDDDPLVLILRHPRLLKQILDVCQSATTHLTADELSARCDGDLSAKRVARYIMMLEGAGHVFDTRTRHLCDRNAVNEYRMVVDDCEAR